MQRFFYIVLFAGMLCGLAAAMGSAAEPLKAASTSLPEKVTFNRHIAPLVFEQCSTCHRPGEVAPFSLLSYADVKKRAEQIQAVVTKKVMPPWKSVEGHGDFLGERRLTPEQIALLARWVEQGAVEGAAEDLPALPKFRDDWKLGKPDIVIMMPEPYKLVAEGNDVYRNFVFSLDVPAGKYIKAVEYRPGNRRIVHHAVLASDSTTIPRKLDEADPEPGYKGSLALPGQIFPGSLSIWVPGRDPLPLPDGLSMPWKPGADFILQLHLHPSGKPESEQSSVGFYLTDEAPSQSMADLLLVDRKIDIPAGEAKYRTKDELVLPIEMKLYGIFPHMHLIGREFKLTAHPPGGEVIPLLWIDDWDFNWQSLYQLTTPIKLAAGTKLVMEGVHDNSADNFRNPSVPPRRVTWGEQTTNEMTVAILQLVPIQESDIPKLRNTVRSRIIGGIFAGASSAPGAANAANKGVNPAPAGITAPQILAKFDRDKDGKLSVDEMAAASKQEKETIRITMKVFDKDGDGLLNEEEITAALKVLVRP